MKIDRSCKTCEFCFRDRKNGGFVCAGERYDEPIATTNEDQPCWSIGLAYWQKLIDRLKPEDKEVLTEFPFISPSAERKAFRAAGVDNADDYLFHCIEQLPEEE